MGSTYKDITILGIESSCDDTSASIIQNGIILSNSIANQQVHENYGGVIPEWASRAHQKNILPVVDQALKDAKIEKEQLDGIAFTKGPGLLGSLLVGSSFAKSMAMALNIPLIGVHHMKAHIMAHFIDKPQPRFPFLCLTVSGGHTQLVIVSGYNAFEVIGTTIDDAAGEAFDKVAKIIGFNYPGGPLIDQHAQFGNPDAFTFVEPSMQGFDYSFSGLKTNILYFLQKEMRKDEKFIQNNLDDLCASVQKTIINILFNKLTKSAQKHNIKEVAIAGGVSANSGIRQRLVQEGEKRGWTTYIPAFEYCTDNAAMIAMMGYFMYQDNLFETTDVTPSARLPF